MKALIAIVNARHRKEWRNAIRETWLPQVPKDKADAFFFQGNGDVAEPQSDEVFLDCDDSYYGLPQKVREIARWAEKKGYSHIMKLDDDVVLKPEEWLNSGYDAHDYTGRSNRSPTNDNPFWVPMGFAYVLSQRASLMVANTELPNRWNNDNDDERWVAETMKRAGILLHDDARYRLHYGINPDRPLRPPVVNTPNRPLRPAVLSPHMGAFAWCIFLEGLSGNKIPIEKKIEEFHRIFKLSNKDLNSSDLIASA